MIGIFALKQNKWFLLLPVLSIVSSCMGNHENSSRFFEDFSFKCYCGITEIGLNDTGKLKTTRHRFYELFYRGGRLDSMEVFHPWNNCRPIVLKCNHKDSVTVFEAVYSASGPFIGRKTYFCFDNHTFGVYQYLGEDGWLVHTATNKQSSRGFAIILKPGTGSYYTGYNNLDTFGFVNKLFRHEKFTILKLYTDTTLKTRITRNFTLNNWFEHDGL